MATKIITKNSSTTTAIPTAGDLVQGELAVNVTDKRLFTENAAGAIVELGTNPSTIDINAGTIDGTVIGGTTAAAISGTTGAFSTQLTVNPTIDGDVAIIGKTTGQRLHVFSNAGALLLTNAAGAGAGRDGFQINDGTVITEIGTVPQLTITSGAATFSGNLSVGTALAENSVGVYAFGTSAELRIKDGEENGTAQISIYNVNTTDDSEQFFVAMNGADVDIGNKRDALKLFAGGSERARIDTSGNLGLGVVPSAWDANYRSIQIGTGGASVHGGTAGIAVFGEFGSNFYFDGVNQRYLTAGASSLINCSNGAIGFGVAAIGTAGGLVNGTGTFSTAMTLDSSGNLLVGTTSALSVAPKLSVESTNFVVGISGTNPTGELVRFYGNSRTVAGTISHLGSSVSYNTTSDQRLKENITDANDAGDKIDAIKVRQYDWKANGSHQDYGMVAQELMTVAPEAVYQPEDPKEMMGIDYSKLVPMLLKEIQSLRSRLDAAGL
jgi:hypothetical protein